jgi:gamma-glutamylcyclotransferase (GGCT)/AIG2-like uncharacterized protein YtfP
MSQSEYTVFVYGTLKPGGHYWSRYCGGKVNEVRPAQIRGTLYDLHVGYPGVRFGASTGVQGYLLTFKRQADFMELDVLEGFIAGRDPEHNEYNRCKVACFSPQGDPLGEVWAYEMSAARIAQMGGTPIEDGNWKV